MWTVMTNTFYPRGLLLFKEVGGLGPDIKFGGKIFGKVQPISPNQRKSFCQHKMQKLRKNQNFGVISERAKFGVVVTYICWSKIWGSNTNFRGKFWSHHPPTPDMEIPPGRCTSLHKTRVVFVISHWTEQQNKYAMKLTIIMHTCEEMFWYEIFGKYCCYYIPGGWGCLGSWSFITCA